MSSSYTIHSDLIKYYDSLEYNINSIYKEFKKNIFDNVFFRNLDVLKSKSTGVRFTQNVWLMRPHVFCYDFYNNQDLWKVVLLTNDLGSHLQFVPEQLNKRVILAPPKELIYSLLSNIDQTS